MLGVAIASLVTGKLAFGKQEKKLPINQAPIVGSTFWAINGLGEIVEWKWNNSQNDFKMLSIGNVYATKFAAEDALMKLRVAIAPERRVFTIEIPSMPDSERQQYVSRIMSQLKRDGYKPL